MARLLPLAQAAVLAEFPWPFALRMEALSPSPAAPPPGWGYAFVYPADAAALHKVYGVRGTARGAQTKIPFAVQAGVVCANEPAANAEYTVKTVTLASWSAPACEALVFRLAADAAVTLTGSENMSRSMLEKYAAAFAVARKNAVNEQFSYVPAASGYIDVRG
jgi:hypothetical protein